jgi:DNA-binding MarR family transcriptional regulator/N-acetylglutamate synthase-like GNAT family acetyltransferase
MAEQFEHGQVDQIRQFNRLYTQRIGVLGERLLESEYSLTAVRVMYEIAHRPGVSASELMADLSIDRGYLSRILKGFDKKRLLARTPDTRDSRRVRLRLTQAGKRVFGSLDERSQQQATALLGTIAEPRRKSVLDAMQMIQRTLDPSRNADDGLVLRTHRPGDIGWVVQRHGELYFREYGWDERFEALVAEIAAKFVQCLDPSREKCWIAERDGERLGCIFLVKKTAKTAKLRLLLVEPHARGLGVGRKLVHACVQFAHDARYRKIELWTQSNLYAARHLYAEAGFKKIREEQHLSFGHELTAEVWELPL